MHDHACPVFPASRNALFGPELTRPPLWLWRCCGNANNGRAGISRDSRHKRRATGGKRPFYRKKRVFESGRQAANTKLGPKRVHVVRGRGGNLKFRALRLEAGNFSWGSEGACRRFSRREGLSWLWGATGRRADGWLARGHAMPLWIGLAWIALRG